MVGIEWDVCKLEAPVASRGSLPVKTAHRIRDFDRRAGNHAAGRIFYHPFNRSGIPHLRLGWSSCEEQHQPQNKHNADTHTLQHFFSIPIEGYSCFLWIEAAGNMAVAPPHNGGQRD